MMGYAEPIVAGWFFKNAACRYCFGIETDAWRSKFGWRAKLDLSWFPQIGVAKRDFAGIDPPTSRRRPRHLE